ncbi:MAG: TetR/AcrR family transcriptional regulator [Myxococcota bacterium]
MKTKDKLLLAAEQRFLQKGYTATTVDEICSSAGATKGAFFHHFPSKEALALTVAEGHGQRRFALLTDAPQLQTDDSVARVYAFIDHVTETMMSAEEPASLISALTLEMAGVNEKFKAVCSESFDRLVAYTSTIFNEAMVARRVTLGPSAQVLAEQFVATLQGSLVLARAKGDRAVIRASLQQFRDYVERLMAQPVPAVQVA